MPFPAALTVLLLLVVSLTANVVLIRKAPLAPPGAPVVAGTPLETSPMPMDSALVLAPPSYIQEPTLPHRTEPIFW